MPTIPVFPMDVARALKRVGLRELSQGTPGGSPVGFSYDMTEVGGTKIPRRQFNVTRGYVVVPFTIVPAAARIYTPGQGYNLRLGSGFAHIWRRNPDSPTGFEMMPQLDEAGNPVAIQIYNLCPVTIVPAGRADMIDPNDPVLFVVQDQWGDFYIVERCGEGGPSFGSASTSISTSVPPPSQSQSVPPSTSLSTSVSTSTPPSTSLSTSVGSGPPSTSVSTSVGGSTSTGDSVSTSTPSGSSDCCKDTVVTGVTFDPVACDVDVTTKQISYVCCE